MGVPPSPRSLNHTARGDICPHCSIWHAHTHTPSKPSEAVTRGLWARRLAMQQSRVRRAHDADRRLAALKAQGSCRRPEHNAPGTERAMSQPPGACRKTHEYELGDRLGGGSFGDVFAATHVPSGRHVAVKRVFERPAERGVERPDPARELRVLESLSHPNVIPLLDHYVGRDGAQMLVFPLLGGGTLADVLRGAGTGLGEAAAKGFAKQLLSALAYLHDDAGVVHRDLKCSNFLLGDGGRLYVSDFGQARWLPGAADATVAGAAAPTAPAAAAVRARDATRPMTPHTGTRWLRAPEVLFGSRSYAAAADVWAVGCIVVELLEGVSPFRAEADIAQLASLATKLGFPDEAEWPELGALPDGDKVLFAPRPPRPAAEWLPRCGGAAVRFIMRCLQWREGSRPSARELLGDEWLSPSLPAPLLPPLLPESPPGRALSIRVGALGAAGPDAPRAWEALEVLGQSDARSAAAAVARDGARAQRHPADRASAADGPRGRGRAPRGRPGRATGPAASARKRSGLEQAAAPSRGGAAAGATREDGPAATGRTRRPGRGPAATSEQDATRAISLIQRPEAAGELFGWDWAEDAVGGEDSEDGVDDAFGGQGLWTLPLSSVALAALGWDT